MKYKSSSAHVQQGKSPLSHVALNPRMCAYVYVADIQLVVGSSTLLNPQPALLFLGLWFREGIKLNPSLQRFWISAVGFTDAIGTTFHFIFKSRLLSHTLPFIKMACLTEVPSLVTVAIAMIGQLPFWGAAAEGRIECQQ